MQIDFFLICSSDEIQAAVVTQSTPLDINHNLNQHLIMSLMTLPTATVCNELSKLLINSH